MRATEFINNQQVVTEVVSSQYQTILYEYTTTQVIDKENIKVWKIERDPKFPPSEVIIKREMSKIRVHASVDNEYIKGKNAEHANDSVLLLRTWLKVVLEELPKFVKDDDTSIRIEAHGKRANIYEKVMPKILTALQQVNPGWVYNESWVNNTGATFFTFTNYNYNKSRDKWIDKKTPQGVAEDTDHGNNQPLRLRVNTGRVQKFIEAVYARYPQTFQNNHVMSWGEGEAQQLALFELVPSMSKRDAVDVKWFQAYPLRQGVGSRAMRVLQDMAREDGISLTLYPWDKGQISQAKLIKFYKSHGFKPTMKGSKNMVWEPVNEQGVAEAFDNPYKGNWETSEYGDQDMNVKLPDGTWLSIMFNHEGNNEWQVEFHRGNSGNSQAITGQGDQQRIFATVIAAIQKFIREENPWRIIFSASKVVEPGQNSESRARLYNRLVARYARDWGYEEYNEDHGDQVTYELTRISKKGVAEGSDAEAYKEKLLTTLPQMMRFFEKNGKGWKPSKEQMLAAVETGYTVMKHTGDVKQAGKAMMDELNRIQPVAEGTENNLSTIIQSFVASPVGQKYKKHDCKTVTRAFVAWAEQNKIPTTVVSLAPPSADFIAKNPRYKGKSGQGDGHIMPIVNGNAIDFTVRQFGVSRPFNNPLVTPISSLPAVYGKFGYFTDKPYWFLGGKSHWIGALNSIPSEIFNQNFGDELLEQGVAEGSEVNSNLNVLHNKKTYQQTLQVLQTAYGDEEGQQMLDQYIQAVDQLIHSGGTIYRGVWVSPGKKPRLKNAGQHWTLTAQAAEEYLDSNAGWSAYADFQSDNKGIQPVPYIISAQVGPNSITNNGVSFDQFPEELEVRLVNPQTAKMKIVKKVEGLALESRHLVGQLQSQAQERGSQGVAEGSEEINWIKPNFDYEWEEIEFQAKLPQVPADVRNYMAKHFPNKQAWMKSVQHGRPVVVSPNHGQKIRNYTDNKKDLLNALSPQSHDPQGPAKAKRVNALFDKGGPIEMPIILKTNKGLWLIGGKTRLGTANLLKGIPAKVWMIGGEQDVAEAWSEKYKRSINCNNPKGFSQRAHCQGRKKNNEQIELDERKKKRKTTKKKTNRYFYGPVYYGGYYGTGDSSGDGGGGE